MQTINPPQDPEFYRELYAEKATPFLRLETPTETTEIMETLRQQHQKEIDAIKAQYEKRLEKIENIIFPKVKVITDWQAEAKRIKEWMKNTQKKLVTIVNNSKNFKFKKKT